MTHKPILVIGSGHLAKQTCRKLQSAEHAFLHVPSEMFIERENTPVEESSLAYAIDVLRKKGVGTDTFSVICIVDREDRMNMRLILAALSLDRTVPIIGSLANENLIPEIESRSSNVRIVNPPTIATARFIESIEAPFEPDAQRSAAYRNGRFNGNRHWAGFPYVFILIAVLVVAAGIELYHWSEQLSWLDSVYYKIVVMTGVGFGDTPIINATTLVKCLRAADMSVTWLVVQALFPALIIGWFVTRRFERLTNGRLRYRYRDHIIVAGLGKFGYHIADALIKLKFRVIVVESDDRNSFIEALRVKWGRKARILVGKANMAENLVDAGIEHARCLIAAVNDDDVNLEIADIARGLRPNLRVVLRLFDSTLAEAVRDKLGLSFAVSTSSIASDRILQSISTMLARERAKQHS